MEAVFVGLIPVTNKKIGKTIGKELEVMDINAIINNTTPINKIVQNDYNELFKESSSLIYWESHISLAKNFEEISSIEEIKPIMVENIFEFYADIPTGITRTTDLCTGEKTEKREIDKKWYESHVLLPNDFKLTFDEALKIYWSSDLRIVFPISGNKITMRRPINPIYKVPYYIFGEKLPGKQGKFILVNAVTGEVSTDGQS